MARRTRFTSVDRGVSAADLADRCRDRDQRKAIDTRSEIDRWLGDPPPDRSVLGQGSQVAAQRKGALGTRVDLWRR
jgi:hypothetical protein